MATVAQSDGAVSPAEVKMLERVYKALGVEPKRSSRMSTRLQQARSPPRLWPPGRKKRP